MINNQRWEDIKISFPPLKCHVTICSDIGRRTIIRSVESIFGDSSVEASLLRPLTTLDPFTLTVAPKVR